MLYPKDKTPQKSKNIFSSILLDIQKVNKDFNVVRNQDFQHLKRKEYKINKESPTIENFELIISIQIFL